MAATLTPVVGAQRIPSVVESDGDPRPPYVRLRMNLEEARERGEPFAVAWKPAVRDALLGIGAPRERVNWRDALWGTKQEWAFAYERRGQRLRGFEGLRAD